MSDDEFSTEPQQIAIDVIIYALRNAFVPLLDKKKEIELLEQTKEIKWKLALIDIRLDAMVKIETKLIAPIKEEYAFIERSVGELVPGDLTLMQNHRQSLFVNSIMQGLTDECDV